MPNCLFVCRWRRTARRRPDRRVPLCATWSRQNVAKILSLVEDLVSTFTAYFIVQGEDERIAFIYNSVALSVVGQGACSCTCGNMLGC